MQICTRWGSMPTFRQLATVMQGSSADLWLLQAHEQAPHGDAPGSGDLGQSPTRLYGSRIGVLAWWSKRQRRQTEQAGKNRGSISSMAFDSRASFAAQASSVLSSFLGACRVIRAAQMPLHSHCTHELGQNQGQDYGCYLFSAFRKTPFPAASMMMPDGLQGMMLVAEHNSRHARRLSKAGIHMQDKSRS